MVKKQSKRPLVYTNSTPAAADSLEPTFPPNYYASHGTDYDIEKENLEEANEEKESKHEDGDSLDKSIPQEQSGDEAGM